ncbi:UNVERIFIED_CONTAM: hypothetical protein Scaly_2999900 [Sesamum calycinum]|uniref:CCHC-type domain-containing protein n=1 Tax=Sesamum calycinum TaxID=2727403 RepID=A0AAW2KFI8_9LAMI
MDQDIHRMGRALNLSEDEEQGVIVPLGVWHGESDRQGFFLVGRILSTKPFHPEALKIVLQTAFNPVKGMDFKVIEDNHFLIRFNHVLDCNRVLDHCLWAYEKCLNIVVKVEEDQNPADIDLNWCEFQVLVQGLPLGKMTWEIAEFVGNRLERFVDLDMSANGGLWGSSLRIRVALDIRQPRLACLKIRTVVGDEYVIYFRYERLPNFCYFCGCLGHTSKFCELQFQDGFVDLGSATPFGTRLRAPPPPPPVRTSGQK